MLGGKISNHDEDEVEDELDAMEAEINGVPLPVVPDTQLPLPTVPNTELSSKLRAKARQLERERQREGESAEQREAMLA